MSREEVKRLLAGKVEVRIVAIPPLIVFLVTSATLIFDMPFCPYINGAAWRQGFLRALDTPGACTIEVAFVKDGSVQRTHHMIASPDTGPSIATAVRTYAPPLTPSEYAEAVEDYQALYRPNDILAMSDRLGFPGSGQRGHH